MAFKPLVSISVVSHKHGKLIESLLEDLQTYCSDRIEVILTINCPEKLAFKTRHFNFPLNYIFNEKPKGFGKNHNAAFKLASGNYFCVLNPDIRLNADPFDALIKCIHSQTAQVGVIGPRIVNRSGDTEDSARRFPTPLILLKKAIRSSDKLDYNIGESPMKVDWVAGMFMLFPSDTFREIGGFNEKYFLYYEDIDLCTRLNLKGYHALFCPVATATHDARRESHRKVKYFKWHITSILRYFFSAGFFKVVVKKFVKGFLFSCCI